jgi:membrane protease YdiL (CAAX protease family)
VFLIAVSLPAFYFGAMHHGMQELYPYYRPFSSWRAFAMYQCTLLFFYISIEFVFRGYLLFGVAHEERRLQGGAAVFPKWALLIQMLSYTAWHLGKPLPELWGTLVWGLAAGAVTLAVRSVWPVIAAHWLLNVFMDWLILRDLGMLPGS